MEKKPSKCNFRVNRHSVAKLKAFQWFMGHNQLPKQAFGCFTAVQIKHTANYVQPFRDTPLLLGFMLVLVTRKMGNAEWEEGKEQEK